MSILAFCGKQGRGKSYLMVREGLAWVQQKKRFLVTNQPLNLDKVAEYARRKRWGWLEYVARNRYVIFIKNDDQLLKEILSYQNSVIMLDEAQVFLNRRFTNEVPRQYLIDIAQQRKVGNDLIWCAQDYERVDLNIRSMTEVVFDCYRAEVFGNMIVGLGFDDRTYERIRQGHRIRIVQELQELGVAFVRPQIYELYDSYVRLEDVNNRGRSVPYTVRPRGLDAHTQMLQDLEAHMPGWVASQVEAWDLARKMQRGAAGQGASPV